MKIFFRWALNAASLLLTAYLLPNITVSSFYLALIIVLVLGLINALIKPLIVLLTLPINILTLGLFTLVINAFLFWFVSTIIKGFEAQGFMAAFWGAILYSAFSSAINHLMK